RPMVKPLVNAFCIRARDGQPPDLRVRRTSGTALSDSGPGAYDLDRSQQERLGAQQPPPRIRIAGLRPADGGESVSVEVAEKVRASELRRQHLRPPEGQALPWRHAEVAEVGNEPTRGDCEHDLRA